MSYSWSIRPFCKNHILTRSSETSLRIYRCVKKGTKVIAKANRTRTRFKQACSVHSNVVWNPWTEADAQKENITCKSMRRLADCVLNKFPEASDVDCPNSAELKFPIGGAGFTSLKILRALMLKVRL